MTRPEVESVLSAQELGGVSRALLVLYAMPLAVVILAVAQGSLIQTQAESFPTGLHDCLVQGPDTYFSGKPVNQDLVPLRYDSL